MFPLTMICTVHVRCIDRSFIITRLDRIRICIAELSEIEKKKYERWTTKSKENCFTTECVLRWPNRKVSSRQWYQTALPKKSNVNDFLVDILWNQCEQPDPTGLDFQLRSFLFLSSFQIYSWCKVLQPSC